MGGKREEVLAGKEKLTIAYHEAGHVLMAWLVADCDRVHKVTVIPRGRALGATQILPEEDRLNISESELHVRLAFMLGGRVAEKLRFDEFSAGAEDDLKRATHLARRMVTHWGMSERLGPVAFRANEHHPFLGKEMSEPREFSEHTAQVIDEEIVRILRSASDRAEKLLEEHRDKLDTLAVALEREEELDERQIEDLIGPPAAKPADQADAPPSDAPLSGEPPKKG
jgi:cell division protease FtsH